MSTRPADVPHLHSPLSLSKFHFKDKLMEIKKRYHVTKVALSRLLLIFQRLLFEIGLRYKPTESAMADPNGVKEDTKNHGYDMCKDNIGGVWAEITRDQFEIERLSGGLTNYLYLCRVPEDVVVPANQPRIVLLRIYGDIATSTSFLVQNSVVFALVAERKMGPKLYGMTTKSRIEEYIPTRCLSTNQLADPTLSQQIAKLLATFHKLDMPLCKEPRWLNETLDEWMVKVNNSLQANTRPKDTAQVARLKGFNLRQELEDLKRLLSEVDSPVVFSHNDLQEGNILYMEDAPPERKLTIIDLEYCSYNYRGHDLGNHFMEWCYNYSVEDEPYFQYTPSNYPKRTDQYAFFRAYLQSSGTNVTDEVLDSMYREVNTFALASHFFWALWSVLQSDMSVIQFGFMEYAVNRFEGYFTMKAQLPDRLAGTID